MVLPERSTVNMGPNIRPRVRVGPVTLQSLHADFDRGEMTVDKFVEGVHELGYITTPEFDKLISSSGGSCSIPFAKLVKTLSVGQHDRLGVIATPRGSLPQPTQAPLTPRANSVYGAILDLLRGNQSCSDFRLFLTSRGIPITQDLDRVLRLHASDYSQTYQDFAVILARIGVDVTKPGRPEYPSGRRRTGNYGNFLAWPQ